VSTDTKKNGLAGQSAIETKTKDMLDYKTKNADAFKKEMMNEYSTPGSQKKSLQMNATM
jgi:hypothetical protein